MKSFISSFYASMTKKSSQSWQILQNSKYKHIHIWEEFFLRTRRNNLAFGFTLTIDGCFSFSTCHAPSSPNVFLTNTPNVSSPLERNAATAPSPTNRGLPTPTMLPMLSTPPMPLSLSMSLAPPTQLMSLTPPTPLGWHPRPRSSRDPPACGFIFMDSHKKNLIRIRFIYHEV